MRLGRSRRLCAGGTTAVRALGILAAVGCCLAGAAYAATRPAERGTGGVKPQPLRPRITVHPDPVTTGPVAEFDFAQPARPPAIAQTGLPLVQECHLDDGPWEVCVGPVSFRGIGRGAHRFAVRAVNHSGAAGPAATFEWRRAREMKTSLDEGPASANGGLPVARPVTERPAEPPVAPPVEPPPTDLPFTIEQVGSLEVLLPGGPAQTIALRIENPNPVSISVVSLTASIESAPPGCPAPENFVLTPAGLGPESPFVVAAESSLPLADVGPTIAMLDLPINQDACEAGELRIALSGQATG
jgi:hypothetical protein